MKLTRSFISLALILSLSLFSFLALSVQPINAQDAKIAVQRGYRTGYSDGYMAGYRDVIENSAKDYRRHGEYGKADRAYNKDYGTLEDYRDGYQQGFEVGYGSGFDKRSFDATLPAALKKRGIMAAAPIVEKQIEKTVIEESVRENDAGQTVTETRTEVTETVAESIPATTSSPTDKPALAQGRAENIAYRPDGGAIIIIPTDTELLIEINDELSTTRSREGDKFTARVVAPAEIAGATIEGRVGKIQRPGRIKRRSEMLLSFDRVVLNESRWSNFNAILNEVMPVKNDNVKRVDAEGVVEGKSSVKGDIVKVSAATGTGIVIGAVAGGPVGAAVGAGVGAAFGVGAVVIERGKDIRLNKNQQLRIKTVYETQIR